MTVTVVVPATVDTTSGAPAMAIVPSARITNRDRRSPVTFADSSSTVAEATSVVTPFSAAILLM